MGNSSTKESRPSAAVHTRPVSRRNGPSAASAGPAESSEQTNPNHLAPQVYTSQAGRSSRPDLSFLRIGHSGDRDAAQPEARRETKAEREARKLERERAAREKERERSMREEGVDGGYLVTLGTYTGPEDFSKTVVRQLMIERRIAPFWKGLNDHSDSWKDHQFVAAVKGLPIPPADEVPPDPPRTSPRDVQPGSSDTNIDHLTVPISSRSPSYASDASSRLSPSHPAFSLPSPTSPISSPNPLFRGRAKTLAASLTNKNNSSADMTPREVHLPDEPYVNGKRIEVFLYKEACECPICFLYYPPYLNKTRCCDQPICSECFVQIKRPDPHMPEHHDDPNNPEQSNLSGLQEAERLVSEPAACPFCVQPNFGVTYEPPPFRRGLVYATQGQGPPLAKGTSAMSSSSSLSSGLMSPGGTVHQRRTTSLSADAPQVITTDRVRPDWAKKLQDARAHALRRSAAATALHNAAYVLGNSSGGDSRGLLGRRRRMFSHDSPSSSGNGTPRVPEGLSLSNMGMLLAAADRQARETEGHSDLYPGRTSSRRNRVEDLEDLMMMEAIRLSLAAEEERKKKEEKEAAKEAKKEEKKKAKEEKKAAKANRKSSFFGSMANDSQSFHPAGTTTSAVEGKGKEVDRSGSIGFNPLTEPTSTLNTEASSSKTDAPHAPINLPGESSKQPPITLDSAEPSSHRQDLRQLSNASSSASSFVDSVPGSLKKPGGLGASAASFDANPNVSGVSIERPPVSSGADSFTSDTPPGSGMSNTEPMFNFRSLAAVIDNENKDENGSQPEHIENVEQADSGSNDTTPNRSRGDSGESSSSVPPAAARHDDGQTLSVELASNNPFRKSKLVNMETLEADGSFHSNGIKSDSPFGDAAQDTSNDPDAMIAPLHPAATDASNQYDAKHYGDISVLDASQQATQ